MDKLKLLLDKVIAFIPKGGSLQMVWGVIYCYALLIVLYIAGWLFNWRVSNQADLASMRDLITIILGPAALAFVSQMASFTVDKDKDNIPDKFEGEQNDE